MNRSKNHAADRDAMIGAAERYIADEFGGSYLAAFRHYDKDKDDTITTTELSRFLKDAGVGTLLTRSVIARLIVSEVDTDDDKRVSLAEFQAALTRRPESLE